MSQRPLYNDAWYEFLRRVMQLTGVLCYQVRHSGQHNIPPSGGVLVVSSHQSHFDPPLVGLASRRRMNYLARDTLFGFAPFRWLINSLDAIPIAREGLGLSGIKESLRRLKRGEIVLLFPEGTRTPDGEIGPFLPGFTALAVRSNSAILPVAIEGAHAAWPRGQTFPRFGTIHIHYGPPILPEEVKALDERKLIEEVGRRVRECHAKLRRRPQFARPCSSQQTRTKAPASGV